MHSVMRVTFHDQQLFEMDFRGTSPMPLDAARAWLDDEFTQMGCEPLRATGKLITADKVLVVARAAGPAKFSDPEWALQFARAASAALGKPSVAIDVVELSINY